MAIAKQTNSKAKAMQQALFSPNPNNNSSSTNSSPYLNSNPEYQSPTSPANVDPIVIPNISRPALAAQTPVKIGDISASTISGLLNSNTTKLSSATLNDGNSNSNPALNNTQNGTSQQQQQPQPASGSNATPRASNGPTVPPSDSKEVAKAHQAHRQQTEKVYGSRYRGVEHHRLIEEEQKIREWKKWGPYLSERQWSTVREDYSGNGDAWSHFPHEHARSRAYRWGEDGIAGISDEHSRLCFSLALWNGKDRILKERLFGVTGHIGNHGEDVKELYYYLDSTPTHSYMKYLYKYPQRAYPYEKLVDENRNRGRDVTEFEITDTDAFDDDRYWDVFVEYAKDELDPDAMSIRITAYNRGPDPADLNIIPQMFFRNTWSWTKERPETPNLKQTSEGVISASHATLGQTNFYCTPSPPPAAPAKKGVVSVVEGPSVNPTLLFTENETNLARLYNCPNRTPYTKDAFHDHIIHAHRPPMPQQQTPVTPPPELHQRVGYPPCDSTGLLDDVEHDKLLKTPTKSRFGSLNNRKPLEPNEIVDDRIFVNPDQCGTKACANYEFKNVPGKGGCVVVRVKMTAKTPSEDVGTWDEEVFDSNIDDRREDADEFYTRLVGGPISDDLMNVQRQALAGMLWSKQFYHFVQKEWIEGDDGQPPPPSERKWVRNKEWRNLHISAILSMPDCWEYPFFAAWDTAFHCIPLALVDPAFAKSQLDLLTREWFMKPDGALPAYEWNFSDVNPPVHAWATFRVFKIERKMYGTEDLHFLERVFQKLLINFTWWVNRKDSGGNNVFEGGFLGLDNIGCFNRSEPLPTGGTLRQADGTAWMAFYALNMLSIALELAKHNPTYEDIASKFFEHFLYIADAMTYKPSDGECDETLWNEEDGFYYDAIIHSHHSQQLKIKSLVGLLPLMATLVLEPATLKRFPNFKKRMDWFIEFRPEISQRNIANMKVKGKEDRLLLALVDEKRLRRILDRMLDEEQFLAETGLRSLSREHLAHPFSISINNQTFGVEYWPGDSRSAMFGGNSNWRGPIWLATNFLIIEGLQRFHQYYGDSFLIECPTNSGDSMTLGGVAQEIQHRNTHLFARDYHGRRAYNGGNTKFDFDPHFRDLLQFHEFFHADSGAGLGASHQTGWTGLVAWHIQQTGLRCRLPRTPRTPRSQAAHYFQDDEEEDDARSVMSFRSDADVDEVGPDDL